jgi:hypothetical protein
MLLSRLIYIGDYSVFVKVQLLKTLKITTSGAESRVKGTPFFVIFLDHDNVKFKTLVEDILAPLQDTFEIGNFYVFQTRDMSYHCVCIDALTPKEVYQIIGAAGCEKAFRKSYFINEYRTWVLRNVEKGDRPPPKYVCKVESCYEGQNPQSLGHSLYLKDNFGIEVDLKNPVGEPRTIEEDYHTSDTHTVGYEEKGLIALEEKLRSELDRIESLITEYIKRMEHHREEIPREDNKEPAE